MTNHPTPLSAEQLDELERLAKAVDIKTGWHTVEALYEFYVMEGDDADFIAAASPCALLALLAEVRQLRADAERYRWLRDGSKIAAPSLGGDCPSFPHYATDESQRLELDAFIDAALNQGGKQ